MTAYEMFMYFFIYGFLGWCTEVAYAAVKERRFVNRGFLRGPICPIYGVGVTLVILFLEPLQENFVLLYVASVVFVTILEGVTGFVLDKVFHNKWWDYSKQPLNIGGYVCLLFSLVWGVACVLIVKFVHHIFEMGVEDFPKMAGVPLLVFFGGVLLVDIYVTATNILKMNKHLAYMEEIANELHCISNDLGTGIYKGVAEVLELGNEAKEKWQDTTAETKEKWKDTTAETKEKWKDATAETKKKWQDTTTEVKEHIAELEKRYKELLTKPSQASKRLMKAFPTMDSRNYKQAFSDIKERIKKLQQHKE
jgi:Predicted membrane protein